MILGQSIHIPNNAIVVTVLQLFNFYHPVAESSGKIAEGSGKVPDNAGYRRIVPDNRTIRNDYERLRIITDDCGRLRTIDKASQKPVFRLLKSKQGGSNE
jgi:hypothetical protein